jgi:hypothetical protein
MSLQIWKHNVSPSFESLQLEFNQYLVNYTFLPTLQWQFQPQRDWAQLLMTQLYVLLFSMMYEFSLDTILS